MIDGDLLAPVAMENDHHDLHAMEHDLRDGETMENEVGDEEIHLV